MATNKKQHYVPKFLMKNFSIDDNGTHINIYNISSNRQHLKCPLKDQAYIDYYYGKDGKIEKAMHGIESENAKLLKDIIESAYLPIFNTPNYNSLLFFTLIQNARTLYTGEEQLELINKISKNIASHHTDLKNHLDEFEMEVDAPTLLALNTISSSFPLAADLKCKLLVNTSNDPFLLSDHPVVFYNQFMENKEITGSKTGLASKGLEILFPISPKHILIYYDSNVYKIGSARQNTVFINKINDITSLNGLQYTNANKNIFFNEKVKWSYIESLSRIYLKFRRENKTNCESYTQHKQPSLQRSALLHIYKEDLKCNLSLSFIKLLKKVKLYNLENKTIHLRNELLYNNFMNEDEYSQK